MVTPRKGRGASLVGPLGHHKTLAFTPSETGPREGWVLGCNGMTWSELSFEGIICFQ